MADVKIAAGVNTIADMVSEPTWANLTADGSFPSGSFHYQRWPAEPNRDGTFFRYYEQLVVAGDLSQQPLGAAMADWTFDYLTRECLGFVKDSFCATGYSATVTIQMEDFEGTTVTYYGTLWWPNPDEHMTRAPYGWENVQFRFRGLRAAAAS